MKRTSCNVCRGLVASDGDPSKIPRTQIRFAACSDTKEFFYYNLIKEDLYMELKEVCDNLAISKEVSELCTQKRFVQEGFQHRSFSVLEKSLVTIPTIPPRRIFTQTVPSFVTRNKFCRKEVKFHSFIKEVYDNQENEDLCKEVSKFFKRGSLVIV